MAKGKVTKMRDKAWKVFALYIKLRDANEYGMCQCCTCGRTLSFDDPSCQAGHFVPGRSNAVLLDDKIVHAQCDTCNFKGGEQAKYLVFMKQKYSMTDDSVLSLLKKGAPVQKKEFHWRFDVISFYEAIEGLILTKFVNQPEIVDRVNKKISTFGVKSIINA